MALNITKQNFDEVVNSGKPVLIDFWAEWCAPCRMLTPVIDDLNEEFKETAIVGKVNVDVERELAGKFQVRSIPSIFLIKNGKVIDSFVGVQPKENLASAITKNL